MNRKVLLVRTAETIAPVSRFLQKKNLSVIPAPLIKVLPKQNNPALVRQSITNSDFICCLSQNAVRYLAHYQGQLDHQSQVWAIGSKTQQFAERYFENVNRPDVETSEGLFNTLKEHISPGCRITLLKGTGGREYLMQHLSAMGAIITQLVMYKRIINQKEMKDLSVKLTGEDISAVMVGSGELLETAVAALPESYKKLPFIVPGERVAEIACNKGISTPIVAEGASGEALYQAYNKLNNIN